MNIKIRKKEFVNYLNQIAFPFNNNIFLKIMAGLKIEVNESNMQITSSNGTLSIKIVIEKTDGLEIIEPGNALISGKLFIEIIKQHNNEINLKIENGILIISSKDNVTNLNLMNFQEYPLLDFDKNGDVIKLKLNKFKKMINNVSYASADMDSDKIILTGINLELSDGILKATATNSFRIATDQIEIDNKDVEFNITIISKDIKDFLPIDAKDEIELIVNEKKIMTTWKNTTITTILIEDTYPDISKLITNNNRSVLKIESNKLVDYINKVLVLSEEKYKTINFVINKDEFKIKSKRREIGNSIAEVKNYEFEGEPIDILFNGHYLKQALSKLSKDIEIAFESYNRGFILRSMDNKKELVQLILPHSSY